jgi:cation:H+ antiporter
MALSAALMIQWARREHAARAAALEAPPVAAGQGKPVRAGVEIAVVVGALVALVGGADLLVRGAQVVARSLGLSEAFIGLTLVALGTSLPELATSIASSIRRENDLLIGNVLGSNLFNSLAVLGLSAVVGPGALDADFRAVSVAMVVISVLAGLFVWSGDRLVRIEGAILVAAYGTFVYFSR